MELMKRLMNEEEGQGLVEYALILGLIALACVTAMGLLSGGISELWTEIGNQLKGINP